MFSFQRLHLAKINLQAMIQEWNSQESIDSRREKIILMGSSLMFIGDILKPIGIVVLSSFCAIIYIAVSTNGSLPPLDVVGSMEISLYPIAFLMSLVGHCIVLFIRTNDRRGSSTPVMVVGIVPGNGGK